MKKVFKTLALSGIAGAVALSACSLAAAQEPAEKVGALPVVANAKAGATEELQETLGAQETQALTVVPEFLSFTGTVKEIRPYVEFNGEEPAEVEGKFYVLVEGTPAEGEDAPLVNFLADENSVILLEGVDLAGLAKPDGLAGLEVTGFYESALPTLMIYPPQYHALVIGPSEGAAVGRFDLESDQISGQISEDTEIIFQNGDPFEGELSGLAKRRMAIVSSEDTITKIVVLFERIAPPIYFFTEGEIAEVNSPSTGGLQLTQGDLDKMWDAMFNPETVQVIVNGEAVEMPAPFINREKGIVMVPVAPIAKALGHNIVGEGKDIVIGRGITFTVGKDSYAFGRMAASPLGAAPELRDGTLFVPLIFFGDIIPSGAYIADGNIYVNDLVDGGEIESIN